MAPDRSGTEEVTDKPANVRLAGPEDEAALYQVLVDLWKHNARGWGFAYDPGLVMEAIECATRPAPEARTNRYNQRRGIIGIIDGPVDALGEKSIDGVVGVYLDPPMWFSKATIPVELFLYVRPQARERGRYERDLARFAEWVHETLRPSPEKYKDPFMMATGFMFVGSERRFHTMYRLWKRLFKSARPVGVLFWRE